MPDVGSTAPARVRTWVAIDQHKLSLVAAILPASGGTPEVVRLESTERAVRRFVQKLGGPEGLAPDGEEQHRHHAAGNAHDRGVDVDLPQCRDEREGDHGGAEQDHRAGEQPAERPARRTPARRAARHRRGQP